MSDLIVYYKKFNVNDSNFFFCVQNAGNLPKPNFKS